MSSNNRLHGCYPRAGLFLLLVNALVPIVTISLFALLHEDTNIFFINSTHFGYRLLEYNIGICFFMCVQKYPVICTKFTIRPSLNQLKKGPGKKLVRRN